MTIKYVWLNIADGTFSNSWTEEEHHRSGVEKYLPDASDSWKLIKYESVTDTEFELCNLMRLR